MTGRPPVGLGTSPLPNDRPRPPQPTLARGVVALGVQPRTVSAMRRLGHAAGGELFDGLAAVHAWWLHLLVESSRVCFDIAYPHPQRGDVSSLAQCGIDPLDSFAALLEHTRRAVVAGLQAPATTTAHTRLSLQLRPTDGAVPVAVTAATACDVSVELVEHTDGHLTGRIDFDADILDPATVAAMGSLWCRLFDAAAADPHTALLDHDLLTDEQRHRQLSWNRYDGQPPACVHDVIAAQTDRTPDATAVSVGDADLTYRQLDDRARVIASSLRAAGAGPGAVVALLLDRGPDVVAAILGSLQAGAAFLPLDPRQPIARNTFCISDTGADFVLTDQHIPAGESIAAAVIDIAALDPPPTVAAPRHAVTPDDPAYVICTSGSTGRPKPVIVEHRGAINLMRGLVGEFGIRAGDTVLSVASIGFDMALFDIFSALACGARVVLADTANAVNPRSLNRLIATRGTTFLFTTPTMWTALIAAGWAGDPRLRAAAGGETLSDGLAEALLARCGAVWNGYGPTEATAGATMARLAPGDIVTVGRPLPNVRVYVVDARGRLNPPGVPGEIVVGGAGVGRGYLNRPDENARRFADDPWHAGGRIYRTGDRGRYLADGRIQHLGRYDDQIKIRGCRIEPGEIESVLGEHPAVRACAVVNCDGPTGTDRLVAYIVAGPDAVGAAAARTWLRRRLPDYMVPSAFVYLDALPMTVSGKLDKAALPAPDVPADGIAQCTATEMRLAELWSELLGGPVTDVHADFFDLGGDSLLAAQLITGVERTFGVTVALEAFLVDGRAVATMAGLIDSGDPAGAEPSNTRLPVHFIFADVASAMSVRHFTDRWGAEQPVHAFIPEQPDGRFDRTVSVEEHARRSLALIRERQPHGPIALAGYSIGGLVAYEVARQAARNGDTVEWLGVVDAVAPPLRRAQLTVRSRLRSVNSRPQRQKWSAYWTFVRRMATSRSRARRAEFDYRGVTDIGCRYRQSGHSIPVAVFASAATAAAAGEPSLGWDAYHDGPVVAHRLGGDHASLLAEPEVGLLADCVHRSLCRAGDVETVGVGGHHA